VKAFNLEFKDVLARRFRRWYYVTVGRKSRLTGCGYIETRTDTTQQSGQTSDKEVEIKNITVYVNGYTERPDSRRR